MTYIHAHSRTIKTSNPIRTIAPRFYIGRVSLMFMMAAFIAILGVVYLATFNDNATRGYELTRLEFERDHLLNVREQKNLDLSRSQSLDQIRRSHVVRGMIDAPVLEYYDGETEVALR